jgi:methanogenic corrinoid protein MtbC1
MGNEFQVKGGIPECGEDGLPETTEVTSWSQQWPGQTAQGLVVPRLPKVARRHMGKLVTTIEGEVIPRLLLSQRASRQELHAEPTPLARAGNECVEEFAELLLAHEVDVALAYIDSVRVRGVPLATVYLELLAPTARRLGELWEDDRCGFADVTVALCRLHEILRALSATQHLGTDAPPLGRRVLLVPVPGEQHTFGLLMVADFFRRAGWEVWSEPLNSTGDLLGLVRHEWFTLVGLSVGAESHLEGLASTIHSLRKAARNRSLGVMVGGALLSRRPELALQLGADATALDGRQAALQADNLVNMLARRC